MRALEGMDKGMDLEELQRRVANPALQKLRDAADAASSTSTSREGSAGPLGNSESEAELAGEGKVDAIDAPENREVDLALVKKNPSRVYPQIYFGIKRVLKEWEQSMAERPGACTRPPLLSAVQSRRIVAETFFHHGALAAQTPSSAPSRGNWLRPCSSSPQSTSSRSSSRCASASSSQTSSRAWQRLSTTCRSASTSSPTTRTSASASGTRPGPSESPWLAFTSGPDGRRCVPPEHTHSAKVVQMAAADTAWRPMSTPTSLPHPDFQQQRRTRSKRRGIAQVHPIAQAASDLCAEHTTTGRSEPEVRHLIERREARVICMFSDVA